MVASSLGAATLRGVAFHRHGSLLGSGALGGASGCCGTELWPGTSTVGPSWVLSQLLRPQQRGLDSHVRAHIKHLPSRVW